MSVDLVDDLSSSARRSASVLTEDAGRAPWGGGERSRPAEILREFQFQEPADKDVRPWWQMLRDATVKL